MRYIVILVLTFLLVVATMTSSQAEEQPTPMIFSMQFKGTLESLDNVVGVFKATTSSVSSPSAMAITEAGVEAKDAMIDGEKAEFMSVVTVIGDGTFVESGTISYGSGDSSLTFNTIGNGVMGPSANKSINAGSILWQITGGTGQFAGATGYITSNFMVNDKNEVTDNHLVVVFPKANME